MELLISIGDRLRQAREAMGKTQSDFAAIAAAAGVPGATRQSQAKYEKGLAAPSAPYMAAIALAGVDVLYVLTGQRTLQAPPGAVLRDGEATLLEGYRALDARGRMGVQALISGMAPHASGMNVQVSGNGSQVVGHISGGSVVIGHPATARRRNVGKV